MGSMGTSVARASFMSKDIQADPTGKRRRRKTRVPRAIRHAKAIVASHSSSAAWGGISGLAAGALSGVIAGPSGVVAGAVLGGAIGAAAGAAVGAGQEESRREDAALDLIIGVTGGNIGEAQSSEDERSAPSSSDVRNGLPFV
jgi:hypothetical protein